LSMRKITMRTGLLSVVAVALALAAPATTLRAQNPPSRPQQQDDQRADDVYQLGTELVILDVSVVDRGNRPVFDIGRDRFQVLEDGAPQTIEFFTREQAPVSMALAIDTSGSMRTKLESVTQAATNLVRTNQPNDETAVIEFKDTVELVEEFTSNESDVEDALADLIANGQTSLLDAIMLASDYVQKDGKHRRKALVLVSDGLEKGSYYSLEQVVDQMRERDVRLYLIGFTQDLDGDGGLFKKSQKEKAEGLLRKLAEETGGRSFFPKDISDLGPITDQIAADLRTVYAIGYYPSNTKKDGTFRRVEVKVLDEGRKADTKLVARTRSGYVADKQ
jgi:Ca-activated chloride channel family protein